MIVNPKTFWQVLQWDKDFRFAWNEGEIKGYLKEEPIYIKMTRRNINELADKKFGKGNWGLVEEKHSVLFRAKGKTKEFTNLDELEKYLND